MSEFEKRPGERVLLIDPAEAAGDAAVVFIGRIRSPWKNLKACPKNLREARVRGKAAYLEMDEPWRAGLQGLTAQSDALVLYWMHEARRDLIIQHPSHKPEPTGVFSLRSPARPNPIAVAAVRILKIDHETGRIDIDAIDCLDGTPLLDVKPWLASVDSRFT